MWVIAVRDLLGLKTEIDGVAAEKGPAFALSFEAERVVLSKTVRTFADGVPCRQPPTESVEEILRGLASIVCVSENEIAAAIRYLNTDKPNLSEGARAAALAALLKDRSRSEYKKAAVVLSSGAIDMSAFAKILQARNLKCDSDNAVSLTH